MTHNPLTLDAERYLDDGDDTDALQPEADALQPEPDHVLDQTPSPETTNHPSQDTPNNPLARRYPTRQRQPSVRLCDFWSLCSELTDEPTSYTTAIQQEGWCQAVHNEINSILKNKTWTITKCPPNQNPITAKWIFKTKHHPNGDINKLKARIVARGFQQQAGIDYTDVFTPVVKWSTILAILALAAQYNSPLWQMDVITAFFNGDINEDIFMEIPHGFPGAGNPTLVCKINCALYGLKQAPKAWYDKINSWLHNLGLTRSTSDPNLYYRRR